MGLQVLEQSPPRTGRAVLARNATLSLGTEVLIGLLLLVTVPTLVHRLGPSAFGLYSLAFAMVGYLSYLDLGVSRAATQFVSAGLAAKDEARVQRVVHSAAFVNVLIGLLCSLAVILITPWLVHKIFKITPGLEKDARLVFVAVAIAVPVFLLQGVFRAVLTSYQRFGVISVINGIATSLQLLSALLLAWKGFSVGPIVSCSVAIRILAVAAYAGFLMRLLPDLHRKIYFDRDELYALLHFGGWVTVSQLILQMLVYFDRVLLASFLSLDAVTLYTVPYEGLTRLRVVPESMIATLYPAMSEHSKDPSGEHLQKMYETSLRYLLLLLLPGIAFIVVFGKELLQLWMGIEFALKASVVLQALAAGFLLNSLAHVSYAAIQAFRKPDVIGKYHLVVCPFYIGLAVLLIQRLGIAGAAIAAASRFALDAVVLFWVAKRYCGCSLQAGWNRSTSTIFSLGLCLIVSFLLIRMTVLGPWGHLTLGSLAMIVYFFATWRYALDARERPAIVRALNVFGRQAAA